MTRSSKIKTFKFKKPINLWAFTDVHIGHKEHDKTLFQEALDRLRKDPNGYCFFNGDNIDFTPPGYHGAECEQEKDVNEQLAEFIDLIRNLGKKVLFIRIGNHEGRAGKLCGVDLGKMIAKSTGVSLLHEGYDWVNIAIGTKQYKLVSSHGEGGNAATVLRRLQLIAPGADMYFTGHTHELVDYSTHEQFRLNETTADLTPFLSLAGGSFLAGAEYARKRNMQPTRAGCFVVSIDTDGMFPDQFSHRELVRSQRKKA